MIFTASKEFSKIYFSLYHFVRFNQTNSNEPAFRLDPNRKIFAKFRNSTENDILRVFVFAKNQKGRSQGSFITEYHLGNYKKLSSDLIKQAAKPSPVLLGLFFTILLLGLTIIARLYWKSRKIKKEIVKEDKYNMESRCSLLKQDTFAVSQAEVREVQILLNFLSLIHSRTPFQVQSSSRLARASRREGKSRLSTMNKIPI